MHERVGFLTKGHSSKPSVFSKYASVTLIALGLASGMVFGTTASPTKAAVTCAGTPAPASTPVTSPTNAQAAPTVGPAETEQSPPGDIPDNQQFVAYASAAGGYSISMPEGWARQETGARVVFSDKLHRFSVDVICVVNAPTIDSARTDDTASLSQSVPAFTLVDVTAIDLPAGPAFLVRYQMNSAPDDVTGKVYRLDVDRYEIYKDGRLAIIELAVPSGSDNVDVSNQVSRSFTWTT